MKYLIAEDVVTLRSWVDDLAKLATSAEAGVAIDIGDLRSIGAAIAELCDDPEYDE